MWKPEIKGSLPSNLGLLLEGLFTKRRKAEPQLFEFDLGGDLGQLTRSLCVVPVMFARARAGTGFETVISSAIPKDEVAALLARMDEEFHARQTKLDALEGTLAECRDSLARSDSSLSPQCRHQLENGLATLETECFRLRDAERFFFARRRRQVQTGEPDDDVEFTVALERIIYSMIHDDELAESVAMTTQCMVTVLLPYEAGPAN